jgi:hypothetical protein
MKLKNHTYLVRPALVLSIPCVSHGVCNVLAVFQAPGVSAAAVELAWSAEGARGGGVVVVGDENARR